LLDYFEPWNRNQAYIVVSALIHVKTRGQPRANNPDCACRNRCRAQPRKTRKERASNTSYAGARVRGELLQLLRDAKALTLVKVGPAQS
jgi:hypothetical protein